MVKLSNEERLDYLRLKREEEIRFKRVKDEVDGFVVREFPDCWVGVLESKKEDVLKEVKLELLKERMLKAQERLVSFNSCLNEKKIAGLKLDFVNFRRQLEWNRDRLAALESGKEVKDKDGKLVYAFEIKYLIDKLSGELFFLKKELDFFGVDLNVLEEEFF